MWVNYDVAERIYEAFPPSKFDKEGSANFHLDVVDALKKLLRD